MPRSLAAALDPIRTAVFGLGAAALAAAALAAIPAPAEAQTRRIPDGSYQRSCRDAQAWNGMLRAVCRTESGQWRRSELNVRDCRGDIANVNGQLRCQTNTRPGAGGPGHGRPGPGGPGHDRPGQAHGRGSITVYEDAGFRGRSLTFRDEIRDLRNTGLNDRISSIRIQGGVWEACSDAYFRGECRRFSADVVNLQSIRFNDRISSLRRIR